MFNNFPPKGVYSKDSFIHDAQVRWVCPRLYEKINLGYMNYTTNYTKFVTNLIGA